VASKHRIISGFSLTQYGNYWLKQLTKYFKMTRKEENEIPNT
jgi:hypothetical protein